MSNQQRKERLSMRKLISKEHRNIIFISLALVLFGEALYYTSTLFFDQPLDAIYFHIVMLIMFFSQLAGYVFHHDYGVIS